MLDWGVGVPSLLNPAHPILAVASAAAQATPTAKFRPGHWAWVLTAYESTATTRPIQLKGGR